jgi:hypothetical protein
MTQDERRRFLTGGAAVAVGAIGAAIGPPQAKAADEKCSSPTFFPNDNLVRAIARAWSDESFKKRLLTFTHEDTADWSRFSDVQRNQMILKSGEALAEMEVFLDAPIVLTQKQFDGYNKKDKEKEIVFVLPNAPQALGNKYSLGTAQVVMALTCAGM